MTEVPSDKTMTVRELFAIAYGNLAMAHYAVDRGHEKYSQTGYMIRARLTKGLRAGTMSIGSMLDDERRKLTGARACSYCGSEDRLTLDHLIPRHLAGPDTGDNLVLACRACNSSKGSKDVLVWHNERGIFPPLMVLRRYLKIAVALCEDANVLDAPVDSPELAAIPIRFDAIPIARFPAPFTLRM